MIMHSYENAVDLIQTMDGGLAILIDASDDVILVKLNSQGEVQWRHSFGMILNSHSNNGKNILIQTMDGGFALAGQINNTLGLIKTDSERTVEWVQTNDHEQREEASSLIQTSDNGFALATNRRLLKFDKNGLILWENIFAHLLNGNRMFVIQTTDGSYRLAGTIHTAFSVVYSEGSVIYTESSWDMRVLKLDSQGQLEWFETYGGENEERTTAFIQTATNSFLLGGNYKEEEFGTNKVPQAFLLKINQDGIMIWNQTYGDGKPYSEGGVTRGVGDLVSTLDGGFAFVDFDRLTKISSSGFLQWEKQYGGLRDEKLLALVQDIDGNFILAGETIVRYHLLPEELNTEDVRWYDSGDAWLIKVDSSGVLQWEIAIDGLNDEEWANKIIETDENSFVLAGITNSYGAGQADMWIVKSNATGSIEWNKTYGGVLDEGAESIIQTVDGGFAFIGYTASFGSGETDIWLVKTDAAGSMEWNQTFGGSEKDLGLEIVQVSDSGFVLAGVKQSSDTWYNWIIKTDVLGVTEWERTYSRSQKVRYISMLTKPIKFIQTADSGFALASSNELIKMDTVGAVEWNTSLDGRGGITSLIQTSDNNYILGGFDGWFPHFHDDGYLIKLNEEGAVQWTQEFEGSPIEDVVQTADGGFGLWIENKPMIIKTGANGVQQWNKTIGELISEDFHRKPERYGIDLILTRDGKFVVTGSKRITGIDIGVSKDIWIAKMDENGTLTWESTYGITSGYIASSLTINLNSTTPSTFFGLTVLSFLIILIVVSSWTRRKKEK
jgi:hypothetical protein